MSQVNRLVRDECFDLERLLCVSVLDFLSRPIVSLGLNVQGVRLLLQNAHAPEPSETHLILRTWHVSHACRSFWSMFESRKIVSLRWSLNNVDCAAISRRATGARASQLINNVCWYRQAKPAP